MVDIRIYRAALLAPLLALAVLMFSFEERPKPLSPALAPDAFDAPNAYEMLLELVRRHPDRRPGSEGDSAAAELVEGRFESLGFKTSRDTFDAELEGAEVSMTNVTGVLSGTSGRQVVLLSHRDAPRAPGATSASGTAVLLELAATLEGLLHRKTFVFVSTDGAGADSAGALRFARRYPDRDKVDAVLVLDDIAAADARRPYLLPWSTDARRSSLGLLRTAEAAVARETGAAAGLESWPGQFVRQAWPLTLREQGPLVREGFNALTITEHGDLPRGPGDDGLDRVSRLRLGKFGRAALSTALALDSGGRPRSSSRSYLVAGRRVLPGWALSLLAVGLLVPALAAAADGFARARRRSLVVGAWTRRVLAAAIPFMIVIAAAYAFRLAGWLPDSAAEALAPASRPSFAEAAPSLGALVALLALGWLVLRSLLAGGARPGTARSPEAAVAVALLLSLEVLMVWLANPFMALALVPAAHLSLLAALPEAPSRPVLVGWVVAGTLLVPVLALGYYAARLDLGLDVSRYLLVVVAGGTSSLAAAVLGSLVAGSLVSMVVVALARPYGSEHRDARRTAGRQSYLLPGSVGR